MKLKKEEDTSAGVKASSCSIKLNKNVGGVKNEESNI